MDFRHFLLSRYNLILWCQDKEGHIVRNSDWLEHRFELFERYCLPSVKGQTCQDFEWIVLMDSSTPERYKKRMESYIEAFPQLIPVYVVPKRGRCFAEVFREEVAKRCKTGNRVLTTYLDNDDALNIRFVEDVQSRTKDLPDGTFINYHDGCQLFADHNYVMRVQHKRNHFMSVVESGDAASLKTVYGYGSHYYIDRLKDVRMEHVRGAAMWCEVVHDRNMDNDAYFLRARLVRDGQLLRRDFGLDVEMNTNASAYWLHYLPRYARTFVRRIGYKIHGRRW